MSRDDVLNDYFKWLSNIVCGKKYSKQISYRKLLVFLHDTEFTYSMRRDSNRAEDGLDLRRRFGADIPGPCSVLEMMIGLSIRCEETIMDNASLGDRTGQWFWGMIVSLGLGGMTDDRFDKGYVKEVVTRFLRREYEPNGKGGLFTIKNCDRDLRDVEIWYQLCWYLDTIT